MGKRMVWRLLLSLYPPFIPLLHWDGGEGGSRCGPCLFYRRSLLAEFQLNADAEFRGEGVTLVRFLMVGSAPHRAREVRLLTSAATSEG